MRTALRTLCILGVGGIALACDNDRLGSPVEPSRQAKIPAPVTSLKEAVNEQFAERLSGPNGTCIVARRTETTGYMSRKVSLPALDDATVKTSIIATYRGWDSTGTPALLAICRIADSDAARDTLALIFGGAKREKESLRRLADSTGFDFTRAQAQYVRAGQGEMLVLDGAAGASPATRPPSRAYAEVHLKRYTDWPDYCSTVIYPPPECEGWMPEDETVPTTPPPEESTEIPLGEYEFTPSMSPSEVVSCRVGSDYPHQSTTPGFVGNINAKAWVQCTAPLYMQVNTKLFRERCFFWVICSKIQIAQSITVTNPAGTYVMAPATSNCVWSRGWYKTGGWHQTILGPNSRVLSTQSPWKEVYCW